MNIDKELDTRGLNCPLPILKAKKALTDMQTGQLLRVVATAGRTNQLLNGLQVPVDKAFDFA